jgi:hypothetical protein
MATALDTVTGCRTGAGRDHGGMRSHARPPRPRPSFTSAAGRAARALLAVALVSAGCAGRYELRGTPERPLDAVIVPGCPSEDDGSLSPCQEGRAVWAAIVWERGLAQRFIVSGSSVHSPYVEAEALAAGMAALGVPADRIYIEPDALHTDENMAWSLRIAKSLGLRAIGVASDRGHATWGCKMLVEWGQPCVALSMDLAAVRARLRAAPGVLEAVRTPRTGGWVPLAEREHREFLRTGRRRPPSFLLYPFAYWLRAQGIDWRPTPTRRAPLVLTWAERSRTIAAGGPPRAALAP